MDAPQKEPMWRRYLRMIRPNAQADLEYELRDHLESAVENLVARGMSPEEARAEALRRFGDVSRVRSEVHRVDDAHDRRVRRARVVETFLYDLRHAARGLRRNPSFTVVAAISIALGVAANATVFSVVNAMLLRPIPGATAPRLQRVYMNHHSPFTWNELTWFRRESRSLEHIVGERYGVMAFRAAPDAQSERVRSSYVTSGYFRMLGVPMAVGRAFDVDETQRIGADPVVVISHSFWQRRFAGDSAVIGRQLSVAGRPLTVVGVTSPEFRSSVIGWNPEIFVPFAMAGVITGQRLDDFGGSFYTTAKLREGLSTSQAAMDLRLAMMRLAQTDSQRYEGRTVRLDGTRGVHAEMRGGVAAGSVFLMAMVAMVLLIACANVANLMLGRAAARRTEMGVRLAIGASRRRLVGQLLTESLLLSAIGTAVGFAIAWSITRMVPAALPPEAGIDAAYFTPDWRVVTFTALLCLVTTLLFGAAPALHAASPELVGLLKGVVSGGRGKRRGKLVAVQTAMCVMLLAVASLFLRGLASARGVDPGFQPQGVIDANIDLGLLPRDANRVQLMTSILTSASAMPGVRSASLVAVVPLSGSNMETGVVPEGMTPRSRFERPMTYFNIVSPGFFATLRQPVIRGREFLDSDREGAPRVAVINQSAARRLWPDTDPIGKRFHWGAADGPLVEVVGVVRDANYVMPGEDPKTTVYMPFAQEPRGEMVLQLRTTEDLATTRRRLWQIMHDIVPALPPVQVVTMTDDIATTLLPVRMGVVLLGAFGLIALVLAAAGIYGVAAYSVASRTREIGVRAALGASRGRLVRMILLESTRRVAIGTLIGVVATIGIAVALSKVLYGVRPVDPTVIVGVAGVMSLVALAATLVPARRAARADPVAAMRAD